MASRATSHAATEQTGVTGSDEGASGGGEASAPTARSRTPRVAYTDVNGIEPPNGVHLNVS